MKVLIISLYDDNYGDMLIRICFERLLKTALHNLGVDDTQVQVESMSLREPQLSRIENCDVIVFPGGGLFGLSYLKYVDFMETAIDIAEERDIPVIFSSIGINNMDADEENEQRLIDIMHKKCIRYVSVREQLPLFERYAKEADYDVQLVCDPAVWTKQVYGSVVQKKKKKSERPVIGLNVVRGGLLRANGLDWTLVQEEEYLAGIIRLLEKEDFDYRLFTNGLFLDCNALLHFAREHEIPDEKVIVTDSTEQVVETIAGLDALLAIRMHSSIIAYSYAIPSVNLVWNDKLPEFYRSIGYEDRAIPLDMWEAEHLIDQVKLLLEDHSYAPDPAYAMTVYRFIYETFADILGKACRADEMFGWEEVAAYLQSLPFAGEEDQLDVQAKLKRGINSYVSLFTADEARKRKITELGQKNKDKSERIKELKKTITELKKKNDKLNTEKDKLKEQKDKLKEQKAELKEERNELRRENKKLQGKLERIYNKLPVRIYRDLKGMFRD